MTKVYIVTKGSYSDYRIDAVFSTKAKAERYLNAEGHDSWDTDEMDIEEWDVDIPMSKWYETEVKVNHNLEPTHVNTDLDVRSSSEGFRYYSRNRNSPEPTYETTPKEWLDFNYTIRTRDHARAVKTALDLAAMIKERGLWGDRDKTIRAVNGHDDNA